MIQIYTDDFRVWDSRLEDLRPLAARRTCGVNKAGTLTFTLPPDHPAYDKFVSHRTVVTYYKDGRLKFRGRALKPADDFYKRRTITCEGERGFLLDSITKPYLYQAEPAAIFADVINGHNAQVSAFKQFVVGTVTVTDPNDYIRLESSKAEKTGAVIDKLVERCGGYIVFTTNDEGQRVINWLAELGYRSSQTIEFGKNLTDYTQEEDDTGLATRIYPYGAKIEGTDDRVTIESVNDGLDFIQDEEAVALRDIISEAVYWDDVTEPANLLAKAQQYLAGSRNVITGLKLTAVDLSALDKSIDSFDEGDLIRVVSKPHGVDEDFMLMDKDEDILNPASGSVNLGKEKATLTGLDVAGDRESSSKLEKVEHDIRAEYTANVAAAVEEAKTTLMTLISQTSEAIKLEVSETYATNGEVESAISTSMTQLADSFTFAFETLQATVDANDADAREQFTEIYKYIRFEDGNIILGEAGNSITLKIENDRIAFIDEGAEVAYFSNKQLVVLDGHFLNSLRIGRFRWLPRDNGNLSLVKVGDS